MVCGSRIKEESIWQRTCYLASKLADQLQLKLQEDINKMKENNQDYSRLQKAVMTDKDKLCIEIAALYHDLGHGPFSHLFDRMFPEAMKKKDTGFKTLTHEEVSGRMFDHMIENNDSLEKEFDKTFTKKDLKMIKDLIGGEVTEDDPLQNMDEVVEDDSQQYKQYMYEIVANKQNAIDVDKMDYFARDCHGLGMTSNFNHLRFISQCRIIFPSKDSNQTTIAVRDKEELNLYELFHTRNGLFRRAYQHQVTHGIQLMKNVEMSEAFENMYAYEKLTDSVLDVILMSKNEELKKAKDLIHRIYTRQLYKVVGKTEPRKEIKEEELLKYEEDLLKDEKQFGQDDFNLQTSLFLPSENFQEEIVLLYSTSIDDEKTNCIRKKWEDIQKK
ncbi:SAMHD1 [Mytilus coruscus]|uniref:SAMHD1 n=1 Tax=Mytilus coruscus TaxID=42192 RepID=A0A6J8C8F3_MYTCO|nr:SAMHD1 [Mytilus coruscus]